MLGFGGWKEPTWCCIGRTGDVLRPLSTRWGATSRAEGLQEGLQQGLQEGLQQGLQEGLQQGLQQALDRLIASGMTQDQAKRLLGLA